MIRYIGILLLIVLSACTINRKQDTSSSQNDDSWKERIFPAPDIPIVLNTEEERLNYLTLHFWSNYDFADTTLVYNRDITEQGLVNYLSLLKREGSELKDIQNSLEKFCRLMECHDDARKVFMDWMDEYLYDPNSPMYDEKLYSYYLKSMLGSAVLDDASKESLQFKLSLISRNNKGDKATSFDYTLPDGKKQTLDQTPVNNNRLLLVFYDPECPHCNEIMQQMLTDKELVSAVVSKRLTVLAIYTEGNQKAWKDNIRTMPKNWIIGTDHEQIKENALYDLKAMPSLYLLDRNKRVLLKDASYVVIRNYLRETNI